MAGFWLVRGWLDNVLRSNFHAQDADDFVFLLRSQGCAPEFGDHDALGEYQRLQGFQTPENFFKGLAGNPVQLLVIFIEGHKCSPDVRVVYGAFQHPLPLGPLDRFLPPGQLDDITHNPLHVQPVFRGLSFSIG